MDENTHEVLLAVVAIVLPIMTAYFAYRAGQRNGRKNNTADKP